MKLHLPKKLLVALITAMAAVLPTTYGADTISINFIGDGGNMSVTEANQNSSLGGITSSGWINKDHTAGTFEVTDQHGQTAGSLTLSGSLGKWHSNVSSNGTVTGEVQKGYIDVRNTGENHYVITVEHDYWFADVILYLGGDSNDAAKSFAPIEVNGTAYIGGTDVLATDTNKKWSPGKASGCTSYTDDNTIKVTNLTGGKVVATNTWVDSNARASLAGMQVVDAAAALVYSKDLGCETVTLADIDWSKEGLDGTVKLENIDESARYLSVSTAAEGSTLDVTADTTIAGLQLLNNTLTLTSSTGNTLTAGAFHAKSGSMLTADIKLAGTDLMLTGMGHIKLQGLLTYTGTVSIDSATTVTLGSTSSTNASTLSALNNKGTSTVLSGVIGSLTNDGTLTLGSNDSAAADITVDSFSNNATATILAGSISSITNSGTLTLGSENNTTGSFSLGSVSNSGIVQVQRGGASVTLNDLVDKDSGKYNRATITNLSSGEIVVENSGDIRLSGQLTLANGGVVTVKGGTFGTDGNAINNKIVAENETTLKLEAITAYFGTSSSSDEQVTSNVIVGNNATLTLGHKDIFSWNSSFRLKVLAGGELNVGSYQQSLRNVELAGGKITGTGGSTNGGVLGLDFYNGGTLTVSENSILSTSIGSHLTGKTIVIDVANSKTLTMDGSLRGNTDTSYTKSGAGTMLYKGDAFDKNLAVNGGIFEYNMSENRTYTGTLSGTGTFKKSGTGTLLLSAASSSIGTLNVSAGITEISGTLAVSSVTAGNGKIVVLENGVLSFTNISGTENLKNILSLTGNKLVTQGDSYILLAPTTIDNAGDVSMTADMVQRSNVVVNGRFDLHGRAWDDSHSNGHVLTIDDAAYLKVGTDGTDELRILGRAKVNVTNGSSLYAGNVVLGEDSVPNSRTSYGVLAISSGSATLQGIDFRKNEGNLFEMTGGRVEFTGENIVTPRYEDSVGSFSAIGGQLVVNTNQALAQSGRINVTLGNVDLQIADNKTLTLSGSLNITGTMTHNGAGSLVFADGTNLLFNSADFAKLSSNGVVATENATDGLGYMQYYVVQGSGTTSFNDSVTFSVDGATTGYTYENGVLTSTSATVYIINSTTQSTENRDADFVGASAYHVNAGGVFTLQANIPNGKTVANILTTTTGTGKLSVTAGSVGLSTTSEAPVSSVFQGDVWVEKGSELSIGSGEAQKFDFSSLNSMVLNGGTLKWQANGSRLKKLDVRDNSSMAIIDTPSNSPITIDVVSIAGEKTLLLNKDNGGVNYWNYNLSIGELTGAGTAELNGSATNETNESSLVINSLQNFTGSLSIKSRENNSTNRYNATVNTGAEGTSFSSLSFIDYGQSGETSTAIFNVQGDTTIGTLSATGATVNISEGKKLTLTEGTHTIGTLSADEAAVDLSAGSTLTLGANEHTVGTLNMGNNSQIIGNFNAANKSLTVDKLNVEAGASASIGTYSKSSTHKGLFNIKALTGTNSTLILKNGSQEEQNTIYNLGGGAGSSFTGDIYVQADNVEGNTLRSMALNIKDATVAQGAVIHFLGKDNLTNSNVGLGITCDTEIAGLSSGGTLNGVNYAAPVTSTIVAGAIEAANKTHGSNATTPVTLTINVGADAAYTTSATVKNKLNLIKKGSGSQTFSGDVSTFDGSIDVQGGILAFTGASNLTSSQTTIASGAQLTLGHATTASTYSLGTLNANTNSTIYLNAGATLNAFTSVTDTVTMQGSGVYDMSGISINDRDTYTAQTKVQFGSDWEGIVKFGSGSQIKFEDFDLNAFANGSQSTIEFDGATGYLQKSTNTTKSYDTNIKLSGNGLSLNNGYGGSKYKFNGDFSGNGKFETNKDLTSGLQFTFAGDMSTWTGELVHKQDKENQYIYAAAEDVTSTTIGNKITAMGNGEAHAMNVKINNTKDVLLKGRLLAKNNAILNISHDANGGGNRSAESVAIEGSGSINFESLKITASDTSSATTDNPASMAAKEDTAGSLTYMAKDASFTIADMELSNINITAAEENTKVNLRGVDATNVQLTKGEFHMLDQAQVQAQVGTGGTDINLVEGGPTGLQFSTSLLNGMTLGTNASIVVDLGDLSGFTGMSAGKPTFSITLEGFRLSDYTGTGENKGLYFAADSWLGKLLADQGASQYVSSGDVESATTLAANNNTVTVKYEAMTGGNVGTIITITGLKVPEPTTSTLGLIALTALVSRRRRASR